MGGGHVCQLPGQPLGEGQGSSETLNPGQKSHTELFVFCLPGAE